MKVNILKITAIALVLAGSFYSCAKRNEAGGEIPYKPCPCDEEMPVLESIPFQGEAYLFEDYPSRQIEEELVSKLSDQTPMVWWIVYDREQENFLIFYRAFEQRPSLGLGLICNFPDFAKEWALSTDNCMVSFKGVMYHTCRESYGVGIWNNFDFILTNIKRK
jgi:hypothetical protein